MNKSATGCGKAPKGLHSQVQECNLQGCESDRDCTLGGWSEWSDCSCSCEGIMHRHRQITDYGAGKGQFCQNATKEVVVCNYYPNKSECEGDKPVDCKYANWTKDGDCTATCDGGQQNWKRDIIDVHQYGGKPCNIAVRKTEECNTQSCNTESPIDCEWHDWDEWSDCDKCSGEMKRTRTIAQMPKHLGDPCKAADSEQITNCSRHCHTPIVCVWSDWKDEIECDASCGKGKKLRKRLLQINTTAVEAEGKFVQQPPVAQSRLQELTVSFACGSLVSFLALIVTMRAFRGESQSHQLVRAAE